jgi:mono/diheme cytochrome c family protein
MPGNRSTFALGVVVGLAIAGLLGVAVVAPIALAHHDASSLETAYGNAVVSALARLSAGGVGANPTTSSAQSLQQGRQSYTGSCSQCHGTAGHTQGAFGQTSFPPATDLSGRSASNLSDGQMFVVIKNGLGFTPMPAFSTQYSDTQIWNIVNFVRSLQTQQAPLLDVPTPTAEQRATAKVDTLADAARGAEAFAAFACSACHQPSGGLSIHPNNDNVADVVRNGRQGMPCFTTTILSDNQLADIQAYIATFPVEGYLGGPQDQPAGGGAPPTGQTGAPPSGGGTSSSPCSTSTGTGTSSSASPSSRSSASPSPVGTPTP